MSDPARARILARHIAFDAAMGGALGALLLVTLFMTDNGCRRLALQGEAPLDLIATLCMTVLAQFIVGAALSGLLFRLLDDRA